MRIKLQNFVATVQQMSMLTSTFRTHPVYSLFYFQSNNVYEFLVQNHTTGKL